LDFEFWLFAWYLYVLLHVGIKADVLIFNSFDVDQKSVLIHASPVYVTRNSRYICARFT